MPRLVRSLSSTAMHAGHVHRIAWVAIVFAGRLDGSVPIADGTETLAAQLFGAAALQALPIRADSRGFLSIEHRSGPAAYFEPPGWRPA